MRYRRRDLAWAPLLVLSAGLALSEVLTVGDGWWLPMVLLAYPAGRRMASLSLALWVFTAVAFTGLALAFWRAPDPLTAWLALVQAALLASVLPWSVGRYRRLRAEQRERERELAVEQARLRERARIARDMHDSLGHELALIALHGGALELAADLTDERRRAIGELRAGAVRATDRLHEIVRVLGGAAAAAELLPADESIEALVRRATSAGLLVRLRHVGPAPEWSPMTGQAAHRVVQESLTNAARHAPGAPVTVTIGHQDAAARVEVVNPAPARPGRRAGTGQGLIGLDERVRVAGGRLAAGPLPDGGWAVAAVLPVLTGDDRPRPGGDPPPGLVLGAGHRLARRRLPAAVLPLGIGLALLVAVAVVQVLTVARTGLSHDRYDALRLGQPRVEVEPLLPAREFGEAPRVLAGAPPPAGASCVYYNAGSGKLDLDPDLYRLCFADGVLVSKDRLERA